MHAVADIRHMVSLPKMGIMTSMRRETRPTLTVTTNRLSRLNNSAWDTRTSRESRITALPMPVRLRRKSRLPRKDMDTSNAM